MSTEKSKSPDGLLTTILRVMANSYPSVLIHEAIDVHGEAVGGWTDIGDSLAYSAAFEVSESFNNNGRPIDNLGNAIRVIMDNITDLEGIRVGLLRYTVERITLDFLKWVHAEHRVTISRGLLISWIEVHSCETVRGLQSEVIKIFESIHPALKENRQFTVGNEFNVEAAIKHMEMHLTKLTGGGSRALSSITPAPPVATISESLAPKDPAKVETKVESSAIPLGLREG